MPGQRYVGLLREGAGLVRYVSVPDFSKIHRFGSVRKTLFPVRRGSASIFRARRGSVRFVSVRFHVRFCVRFRPVPELILHELFELILLLELSKQFPVEDFESTVSQSTVPSPLLTPSD